MYTSTGRPSGSSKTARSPQGYGDGSWSSTLVPKVRAASTASSTDSTTKPGNEASGPAEAWALTLTVGRENCEVVAIEVAGQLQWSLIFAVVLDLPRKAEDPVEGHRALEVRCEAPVPDPESRKGSISGDLGP
jgi:hypothetical protein